jgi:hypothetical protein
LISSYMRMHVATLFLGPQNKPRWPRAVKCRALSKACMCTEHTLLNIKIDLWYTEQYF